MIGDSSLENVLMDHFGFRIVSEVLGSENHHHLLRYKLAVYQLLLANEKTLKDGHRYINHLAGRLRHNKHNDSVSKINKAIADMNHLVSTSDKLEETILLYAKFFNNSLDINGSYSFIHLTCPI